jgi:hypothetical protein
LFIGLIGTTMPPAFHAPSTAIANCGTFWRYTARRSPLAKPSATSPAARASLMRSISPTVSVVPA